MACCELGLRALTNVSMCVAARVLVLVLAWQLVPGMGEVVENALHLLSEGHTAHALADADHAPEGDEHGCSGPFHLCSCHSSAVFVSAVPEPHVACAAVAQLSRRVRSGGVPCDGFVSGVYRPPIA